MAPSISDEELREEFSNFSMKFESDEVLLQMKLLCIRLDMTVEELCDDFLAFIQTIVGSKSKTQETILTLDRITQFEKHRQVQAVQKSNVSTPLSKTPLNAESTFRTPTDIHRPAKQFSSTANSSRHRGGHELVSPYGRIDFSDAAESTPTRRPLEKPPPVSVVPFGERKNKGEIVASFGELPEGLTWAELPKASASITVTAEDPSNCLSDKDKYPFMFVKYQDVALALNCNIDEIGGEIAVAHNITEYSSPAVIGEKTTTLGRLLPSLEGQLNIRDLWLQASSTLHSGVKGRLDLDLTQRFSLFPGQIIGCTGHGNANAFAVEKIFQGVTPQNVKVDLPRDDTLHLLVACGPFSLTGEPHDDVPAPLRCLIQAIQLAKPDMVILLGPFIEPRLVEDEAFLCDYTFADHFKTTMEFIFTELVQKLGVHIVIVPSTGQLVGMPVYPVAPLTMEDCVRNPLSYSDSGFDGRIIFVPEPTLINVNGLVVGLTSTDILSHLCQKEINYGMTDDRIPRLAGHLLQQQSFYPLYPTEVPADIAALTKYARMRFKPHILVTPSDVKGFARLVDGTVCLNPERVAKQYSGGSYARIFVSTTQSEKTQTTVDGRIAVEIVRV